MRAWACAVVAVSMISATSWSQPTNGSDDDQEEGSAGSGTSKAVTAPKDPKARDQWLVDKLGAAITTRTKLGKTKLTYAIRDVTLNKPLAAREPDAGMNLASTTKLLTSTAALATLGGGFRWRTGAYVTKPDDKGTVEDLYIRGRGDPLLSANDLRALANDIAAKGVKAIDGKLVIDTSYFDNVVEPPHFDEQKQERSGFRAPIAAFGVARSAVTVIVTANGKDGDPQIRLEPDSGDYVRITKREVTSSDKRSQVKIEAKPKPDHLEIEVSGTIRAQDGSWDQRRRVDDPARFAAEVFKKYLAERGIKVKRIAIGGVTPTTAKLVAVHDSGTLANALREMNKLSDNYIAESVLKTLGAETRKTPGPATWADGTAAVAAYLGTIGIAAGSYRADNGSGLFASTSVSAAQLATLLAAAWADFKVGPDLMATLPVGGIDGTLARRWHNHAAQGRVRAKTGTLDRVISLAGYIALDSNHVIAFSMLANEIAPGAKPVVREAMDEMVDVLAAYLAK